jgi:Bor protein
MNLRFLTQRLRLGHTLVRAGALAGVFVALGGQANFLSGFGQQHTIDAVQVCGSLDKVASVEVEQSLMDAVIATVTLGIYTPLSARVYCKS